VLTKDTSMWNAWIGFNARHSLGALLVAAVYVPLALFSPQVIAGSLWFSLLPVILGGCYVVLAKTYWFKIPLIGTTLATGCFSVAALLMISA
jgi:hypothetical protein